VIPFQLIDYQYIEYGGVRQMNPTNSCSMWGHTPDEVFLPQKYTNIKIIGGHEYGKINNVNSTKSGI